MKKQSGYTLSHIIVLCTILITLAKYFYDKNKLEKKNQERLQNTSKQLQKK